ncbi:MAG: carbamate kinase [Myxococcales bacterium]|nr:carbamate kinase [Myxococcales bacterium]
MLVVVALGGNALIRRGEPADVETQRRNAARAARAIAELAESHRVVVTHGNGPQVGLLALQSEAYRAVSPYPLDVLGAESEGMIGYLLEQELRGAMPGREVATLLTQVEVDPRDPAFAKPSKPVGPIYSAEEARSLATKRGWTLTQDESGRYQRVVPSPEPIAILELATIRLLVDAGVVAVCVGGGGIPVTISHGGSPRGAEAVIDKDFASALLATNLAADALLLLTDQPAVFADWPNPATQRIPVATPSELRARTFEAGSMAPKVEAACRFVDATRGRAGIGALADASRLLDGRTGTTVVSESIGRQ